MLFRFEDEVEDLLHQLNFLLANKEDLSDEAKGFIKSLSINFIIDLHSYLKENDIKTYNKLLKEVTDELDEKLKGVESDVIS